MMTRKNLQFRKHPDCFFFRKNVSHGIIYCLFRNRTQTRLYSIRLIAPAGYELFIDIMKDLSAMTSHSPNKKNNRHSSASGHHIYPLILIFFFLSGITGLMYEILWTRMIETIIGNAPYAVSIVLTVFMGGLGLGSWLAGRIIDRDSSPDRLLRIYGLLELTVGAWGIILPVLLLLFRPLYSLLYNTFFHQFTLYNLLTFTGCATLLIVPSTCMGATLPVLSRFYVTSQSVIGSRLGRLYGINTIGAAIGSFLCGFWIIGALGVYETLALAIVMNSLLGLACILLSRTQGLKTTAGQHTLSENAPDNEKQYPITGMDTAVLAIFAVSGFCSMTYEVIWTKLLGLIVGPTTYSFTIVITVFILGLALGSMFFGWLVDRMRMSLHLLVGTQIAAAFCAVAVSQVLGSTQLFFAKLIYVFQGNFVLLTVMKTMMLFIIMLPVTFLLGATFPLVGKIYVRSIAHLGRSIGFAYSINTIGAVLGSFSAGFILIPLLGKEHSLALAAVVQLLTAFGTTVLIMFATQRDKKIVTAFAIITILTIVMIARYPRWDRYMLSIGKYHRVDSAEFNVLGWLDVLLNRTGGYKDNTRDELVYFGDGVGGFTVVTHDTDVFGKDKYCLFNSGKADASLRSDDMFTQTLLAHFPLIFHPNPESVMVLGLASGITAGETLNYPVKKLDVIDINKQVVKASDYFIPWNNNVLRDPRTELIIQDGRAHIQLTDRTYDVIISEPSNPWMAGLASLFTKEFFSAVDSHLNDGGIFCQWVHTYQIDWENFSMIGRTFASVFPKGALITFNPGNNGLDYLLIGLKGNRTLDPSIALNNYQYASKSHNMVLADSRIFTALIFAENLTDIFGPGTLNTQNHPLLEFNAPKQISIINDPDISENLFTRRKISPQIFRQLQQLGTDVDLQIDLTAYLLGFCLEKGNIVAIDKATPKQSERYKALMMDYCSRNLVQDFSFIAGDSIRTACIDHQIASLTAQATSSPHPADIYLHIGVVSEIKNDIPAALAFFNRAIQADPENTVPYYNIGYIYEREGNYDQAFRFYQEALAKYPYYKEAHNNIAILYDRMNQPDEAIRHLREALRADPSWSYAHKNLGILLNKSGRTEEGQYHLQKASELEKKSQ
jgi:spermidine synthase